MVKVDLRGVEQSISVKAKQLLYIIESHAGIKLARLLKSWGFPIQFFLIRVNIKIEKKS